MDLNKCCLYLDNIPSLEEECRRKGVRVEPNLNFNVTHIVVENSLNPPQHVQDDAKKFGIKIVSYGLIKTLISGMKIKVQMSPLKSRNSVKPLLVVSDCDRKYRPLFFNQCHIPCQIDVLDSGSPFQDDTNAASKKLCKKKRLQYCEHCGVIVTNINEHVDSEMHIKHSRRADNFTELDCLMMELSLEHLLAVKEEDSNSLKKTII